MFLFEFPYLTTRRSGISGFQVHALQLAVAVRAKTRIAFPRSSTLIVGSNPTLCMSAFIFCVYAVLST
jgi:hypothetical protein